MKCLNSTINSRYYKYKLVKVLLLCLQRSSGHSTLLLLLLSTMDTSALIDRIKDVLLAYTFLQNYDPEKSTLSLASFWNPNFPALWTEVSRTGYGDKVPVFFG
ncbi:hypothetical protein L596_001035 [Steinernema carpocapsae]|uniref:Uncharacterized protein n=1 Tax=Steinernema carpocapsae TaxID=34508 RepID=A0A4U8UKF0_STECR|nr:hypothetical protein L596_001035 [Steinernema carpocapsae]